MKALAMIKINETNCDESDKIEGVDEHTDMPAPLNIYDPRTWDNLDSKSRDLLVEKGPVRDLVEKCPKDKLGRRFSSTFYTRCLSNGEKVDRTWLVYSKELDKVFFFCCKLFKKGHQISSPLVKEGYNDGGHLSGRLKEHETGSSHINNMRTWFDLRKRLEKCETIDKHIQEEINREKEHWKGIL